jgi:dephospho-CoA kinase
MEEINNKNVYKIAFCGKMGAGKTSATLISLGLLTDKYGPDAAIGYVLKFAQPLYQSMLAFHRNIKGSPERVFLQRLGDLARREFGDTVFETIFEENVNGLITNRLPQIAQQHVLIMTDDLRFLGEYNLLRKLGFTIINIEAAEEIRKERTGDAFINIKHRSEIEQDLFEPDFTVANDYNDIQMERFEAELKHVIEDNNLL